MTSTAKTSRPRMPRGRRAAIGFCAATVLATAGCVASPRYPVERGEAPGDGGVHLGERPQYPVDPSAAGAVAAPPAVYPVAPVPPPPANGADEEPHAPAASAPVDSSDLPPPPGAPPATSDAPGQAELERPTAPDAPPMSSPAYPAGYAVRFARADLVIAGAPRLFPDAVADDPLATRGDARQGAPMVELAAYRHHHHPATNATTDSAANQTATTDPATTEKPAKPLTRAERRRLARAEKAKAAAEATIASLSKSAPTDAEPAKPLSRAERRRLAKVQSAAATQAAGATAPTTGATDTQTARHLTRAERRRLAREELAREEKAGVPPADAASPAPTTAEVAKPLTRAERRRLAREEKAGAQKGAGGEAQTEVASKPSPPTTYEIRKGDTLYAIAHRFKVDTDDLAKLNGLSHARLQPGETVRLPTLATDQGLRAHADGGAVAEVAPPTLRRGRRVAAEAAKGGAASSPAGAETTAAADQTVASPEGQTPEGQSHEGLTRADRAATRRAEREARVRNARFAREQLAETAAATGRSRRSRARFAAASATTAAGAVDTGAGGGVSASAAPATRYSPPPTQLSSANLAPPAPAASPPYGEPSPYTAPQPSVATTAAEPNPTDVAPARAPVATASPYVPPHPYVAPQPYTAPSPYAPPAASAPAASIAATRPGYRVTSSERPPTAGAASRYGASAYAPSVPARAGGYYSPASPYVGGGYVPGQVATLNAPSYREPVLGRVRPAAPVLSSGAVTTAEIATAGHGRFVWPLHGAILQPFGDHGPGQRNDGLDIAAAPGESVRAAASGEVVYAGSSIPGFGNLVLVKHPGGWVTAYAHLDRIEVRMRDTVSQGEEIGQAGQTGAVTQPQLHFEVRYAPDANEKARPVDPALVLPGAG